MFLERFFLARRDVDDGADADEVKAGGAELLAASLIGWEWSAADGGAVRAFLLR